MGCSRAPHFASYDSNTPIPGLDAGRDFGEFCGMTEAQAARELANLPQDARRVVLDMIAILGGHRGVDSQPKTKGKQPPLAEEKFIGMWRDREDLADSTAWVRALREREWSRR